MKTIWFKKIAWVYLPISLIGKIITLLSLVFCYTVFAAADRNAHTVSDMLYGIFPYFVCSFAILFWLAGNTSSPSGSTSNGLNSEGHNA